MKDVVTKRVLLGEENNVNKGNMLHIAFGIDCNFVLGMGVLITSLILNNKEKSFCFHIFTDDIKSEDLGKLTSLVENHLNVIIKIYYLDIEKLKALPVGFTWTYAIYYRFIICEELFEYVAKVLYLDSDILCLNAIDVSEIDFNGKVIAAVEDISDSEDHANRLFNGEAVRYFSSGVMYIDVQKWRNENVTERAIDLLLKENNYKYFDQDVLNQLLRGKVEYLNKKYNYIYNLNGMKHAVPQNTVFLHFAGSTKPWQRWAQDHFLVGAYLEYKKNSLWRNVPIQEPKTYKQAKFMARASKRNRQYGQAVVWSLKYIVKRIKEKVFK